MNKMKWLLVLGIGLMTISTTSCRKYKERDEQLQYQIDMLASEVHKLHLDILQTAKRTDSLVARMDSTDLQIAELKESIILLKDQMATVLVQIETIRTELSGVKVDLAKVISDLNKLTANVVTIQNNYLNILLWIQNHRGNNGNNGHSANLTITPITKL